MRLFSRRLSHSVVLLCLLDGLPVQCSRWLSWTKGTVSRWILEESRQQRTFPTFTGAFKGSGLMSFNYNTTRSSHTSSLFPKRLGNFNPVTKAQTKNIFFFSFEFNERGKMCREQLRKMLAEHSQPVPSPEDSTGGGRAATV